MSAADHRRYARQEKAKYILQQQIFAQEKGELTLKENPFKYAKLEEKGVDPTKSVTCPFCLGLEKLRLFLVSTKKGFDRGNGKCPLCGHRMRFQTLLKVMSSPEQYAVFAFTYPAWSFWERVKHAGFNVWKRRLKMMDWTERFWDEYKRQRGDTEEEEEERRLKNEVDAYERTMQNPERAREENEAYEKSQARTVEEAIKT
jgi:hypothetical protein